MLLLFGKAVKSFGCQTLCSKPTYNQYDTMINFQRILEARLTPVLFSHPHLTLPQLFSPVIETSRLPGYNCKWSFT